MTEPHWPADGSGDEADGGYDPTAYRIGTEELAKQIEDFLEPKGTEGPIYLLGAGAFVVAVEGGRDVAAAPFVQVRVNGELVPGHIVYPWPDGLLVVEPLEA